MTQPSRNEIIQINGLTILLGMTLVANFLIVGFFYRYHSHQSFVVEKIHNIRMQELYAREHELKLEVIDLEGVKTWNDTLYIKQLGK